MFSNENEQVTFFVIEVSKSVTCEIYPGDQDQDANLVDEQQDLGEEAGDAGNLGLNNNLRDICCLCQASLHDLQLRKCQGCKKVAFFRSDTNCIFLKSILCFDKINLTILSFPGVLL